jgi:hypothetical protein
MGGAGVLAPARVETVAFAAAAGAATICPLPLSF